VARFRNSFNIRPVNRIKHVYDEQNALVAGTQRNSTLVEAKDAPVLANTTEVITGSRVNGIYLKVEGVATSSAALTNCYFLIWKDPGNNIGTIAANTVGSNDNKRFVIHQNMVMFQEQTGSNPRTIFQGVIMLPKLYRRFAPNDTLKMGLLAPGVSVNFCIQCHYKEFR